MKSFVTAAMVVAMLVLQLDASAETFCGKIITIPSKQIKEDGSKCECGASGGVVITLQINPISLGPVTVGVGGSSGGTITIPSPSSGSGSNGSDDSAGKDLCWQIITSEPSHHDVETPGPALVTLSHFIPGKLTVSECDQSKCPGFLGKLFGLGGAAVCQGKTSDFGQFPLYKVVGNCGGGRGGSGGPLTGGPGTGGIGGPGTGGPSPKKAGPYTGGWKN